MNLYLSDATNNVYYRIYKSNNTIRLNFYREHTRKFGLRDINILYKKIQIHNLSFFKEFKVHINTLFHLEKLYTYRNPSKDFYENNLRYLRIFS